MKSSLITFESGVIDLKYYIEGLELESKLLSFCQKKELPEDPVVLFKDHVLKAVSSKKRLNYNMIIVSLYGIFEHFIESIIVEYMSYLNKVVPSYEELPDSIIKNHLDLSFELISRGIREKSRNHSSANRIIHKLNSCLSHLEKYEINNEAFSLHSANFRIATINDAFSRLGIKKISDKIRRENLFVEYIGGVDQGRDTDDIDPDIVFNQLNDLAERRNEVAHGINTDQILSNELLLERIRFVDAFSKSLYEIVYSESLLFKAIYTGVKLGKPISVFNNNIACFSIKNLRIKVGDMLIAEPANASMPHMAGKINEIQINRRNYNEITKDMSDDIAFRVDFKIKDNQTFFLVCQN